MKLTRLAVTTCLLATGAAAWAADVTPTVTGSTPDWTTATGNSVLSVGIFTDVFRFGSFSDPVVIDGDLSTDSFAGAAFNINFISAVMSNGLVSRSYTLNGEDLDGFETANLDTNLGVIFAAGVPITLTMMGTSGGTASYNANVNFTSAVPEPGSSALVLAGLGVVGLLARRRRIA